MKRASAPQGERVLLSALSAESKTSHELLCDLCASSEAGGEEQSFIQEVRILALVTRQSNCSLCGYLCGLLAHFNDDGTPVKVEPDPARYPYDAAIMRGCRRFAL